MTTLRTAVQQALEAMLNFPDDISDEMFESITVLKTALAEPVQEPAAWRYKKEGGGWFVSDNEPQYVEQWNDIEEIQPLYTAPPQRKPLTEDEIAALTKSYPASSMWRLIVSTARTIEAAHGIKENPDD